MALFVYPFLYGLGLSFQPEQGGAVRRLPGVLRRRLRARHDLAPRFWLALPAALINVGASVPIAYRMRGRFRGKRLLTTVLRRADHARHRAHRRRAC